MSSSFHITGERTFQDFLEAREFLSTKRRLFLRGVCILYGSFLLYKSMPVASRKHAILLSIGALLVVYGVLISPLLFRISARRTWSRYPKMQKPVDMKLSQKGVELPDDRNCPAHFNWDNFTQLRESKNLLLIYMAPGHAVTIPKRLIPDADLDAVRQMISACVQPPKPTPANAGPNH